MPISSREKVLEGLLPDILEVHARYSADPLQDYVKVVPEKSLLLLQRARKHVLTCLEDSHGNEEYMWLRYGATPTTIRLLEHSFLTLEQVEEIRRAASQSEGSES